MTGAFDRAAAAMFGNADMGVAAVYYPGGVLSAGVNVSVILSRADQSPEFAETQIRGVNTVMAVRIIDAPELAKGDLVYIGTERFRISSAPLRDAARTTFKCLVTRVTD